MTRQDSLHEYEARLARSTRNASVVALIIVGLIAIFFGETIFQRNPVGFAYAFLLAICSCALVCILSIRRLNMLTSSEEMVVGRSL